MDGSEMMDRLKPVLGTTLSLRTVIAEHTL